MLGEPRAHAPAEIGGRGDLPPRHCREGFVHDPLGASAALEQAIGVRQIASFASRKSMNWREDMAFSSTRWPRSGGPVSRNSISRFVAPFLVSRSLIAPLLIRPNDTGSDWSPRVGFFGARIGHLASDARDSTIRLPIVRLPTPSSSATCFRGTNGSGCGAGVAGGAGRPNEAACSADL